MRENNDLIRRSDALYAARVEMIYISEKANIKEDVVKETRARIASLIETIPAVEEEAATEAIRIDWEPVKGALDGIIQRTISLVDLNPTRTDETWLWINTMAGALLEVIRKLEGEE